MNKTEEKKLLELLKKRSEDEGELLECMAELCEHYESTHYNHRSDKR